MGGGGSLRSWALAGLAGLAAFALLRLWTPTDDPRSSLCLFRRVLGLSCPGCGMTRALAHLAKGEWSATLATHPLAPLLAAELGLLWAGWGASLARGAGGWKVRGEWVELLLVGHLVVFVALWLGRLASGTLP